MSGDLRGKGMYIWQLWNCEGGDVGAIAAKATSAGLTHVLVKVADGRSKYNGDLTALVERLSAAGIDTWAWQYTYGTHAVEEAEFAAQRFSEQPFAGFVVNAEQEYKGHPGRATGYMERLRELLPDTPVALSSYYLPDYHPSFPWSEFLAHCDINMPQVYWYNRDPVTALTMSLEQMARFGRPILPTGAAYPEACEPSEIVPFLETVREAQLPGANFWDWQHCTPPMWDAITAFAWRTPAVVVAVPKSGAFDYTRVPNRFATDRFEVRPSDIAPLVGLTSADESWTPIRTVAADLNLNVDFATEHLGDPVDPRIFMFVYPPLPTAAAEQAAHILEPLDGATVSGLVAVKVKVTRPEDLPEDAALLIQVKNPEGLWVNKAWAIWAPSGEHHFVFAPGWDTSGTPEGPNGIKAILYDKKGGEVLAEAEIAVTVRRPGYALAGVARHAETERFIMDSVAGGYQHLHEKPGWCRAYAAECLAEFYVGDGEPNKRHTQGYFTYSGAIGTSAHTWGTKLRQGVDSHRMTWLNKAAVYPEGFEPGDMVFWIKGVSGYTFKFGHVAIVTDVHNPWSITVSENSSSRGIGTHPISKQALSKIAGVARWRK